MQATNTDNGTSTLKTTRTQDQILSIVSEVLRINCGSNMCTHAYLHQVDMKIKRPDKNKVRVENVPCQEELSTWRESSEVIYVTVRSQSVLYGIDWNNAIAGTVEAKLRLFRNGRCDAWKLHYVMLILPDLSEGRRPSMYVAREFTYPEHLTALIENPGRFHTEHASHAAIDRTGNALDLLRLSQLILGERVIPWETLHPKVPEPAKAQPVKQRSFIYRWTVQPLIKLLQRI